MERSRIRHLPGKSPAPRCAGEPYFGRARMSAEPEPPEPPRVNEPTADAMTPQEVLGWAEFCCWSALVMAPLIWWLQGPSVSTDQFVVRTALVVISTTG